MYKPTLIQLSMDFVKLPYLFKVQIGQELDIIQESDLYLPVPFIEETIWMSAIQDKNYNNFIMLMEDYVTKSA